MKMSTNIRSARYDYRTFASHRSARFANLRTRHVRAPSINACHLVTNVIVNSLTEFDRCDLPLKLSYSDEQNLLCDGLRIFR